MRMRDCFEGERRKREREGSGVGEGDEGKEIRVVGIKSGGN
jgi:hypothetical protein